MTTAALTAAVLAGAGAVAVALSGCGGGMKTETCVPACPAAASCRDSCGGLTCPCPGGDVCDPSGACRPCVVGSCAASPAACVDECGNPDNACTSYCAQPDACVDECGMVNTAVCAGVECDPRYPAGCLDTCGQYAPGCCCVATTCVNPTICADDCRNFNPYQCAGQACGGACQDTCGQPDGACWVLCADPSNCLDDCGNFNSAACSGEVCDPIVRGFDTCGILNDGC